MCDFDTLYHGDDGYVVRCTSCNHYQLAFGTLCITLQEEDFVLLQKMVGGACASITGTEPCGAKRFSLGTPFREVNMLLNKNELLALRNMLDMADSEAKALWLIGAITKQAS